jgi:hypothetical protein
MTTHIPGPFTAIIENISEADARLIAAAPDLLAALKWAEAFLALALEDTEETRPYDNAMLEQARAAIAKAEGQS